MTDWERCAAFHGHQCPGLTIGFKAAQYAKKLLEAEFSDNEQLVCIAENDACGVDAIQVLLGCSIGKGNLLFHMTGKQAYSFYHRGSGRSVRLLLTNRPEGLSREEAFAFYQRTSPEELFTAMPVRLALPERAASLTAISAPSAVRPSGQTGCGSRTEKLFAWTAAASTIALPYSAHRERKRTGTRRALQVPILFCARGCVLCPHMSARQNKISGRRRG